MQACYNESLQKLQAGVLKDLKSKCIVVYDTETTGLKVGSVDQVVELGAICFHTGQVFEQLITLNFLQFHDYTGEFTGITPDMLRSPAVPSASTVVSGTETKMVPVSSMQDTLTQFLQWLKEQCREDDDEVILIAHNNHRFDMVAMERHLAECKLDPQAVLGKRKLSYADSLAALRRESAGIVRSKYWPKPSLTLSALLNRPDIKLHRALADCQALVVVLFERFKPNVWQYMWEGRVPSKLSASSNKA